MTLKDRDTSQQLRRRRRYVLVGCLGVCLAIMVAMAFHYRMARLSAFTSFKCDVPAGCVFFSPDSRNLLLCAKGNSIRAVNLIDGSASQVGALSGDRMSMYLVPESSLLYVVSGTG